MIITVSKKDLLNIVKHCVPCNDDFSKYLVRTCGRLDGRHVWVWDEEALNSLSEDELYELYNILRNAEK